MYSYVVMLLLTCVSWLLPLLAARLFCFKHILGGIVIAPYTYSPLYVTACIATLAQVTHVWLCMYASYMMCCAAAQIFMWETIYVQYVHT